jgi:hypothetical protein
MMRSLVGAAKSAFNFAGIYNPAASPLVLTDFARLINY